MEGISTTIVGAMKKDAALIVGCVLLIVLFAIQGVIFGEKIEAVLVHADTFAA